jgi:hypothetical protein
MNKLNIGTNGAQQWIKKRIKIIKKKWNKIRRFDKQNDSILIIGTGKGNHEVFKKENTFFVLFLRSFTAWYT